MRQNVRIDLMPTNGLPELHDAVYQNIVSRVGSTYPEQATQLTRKFEESVRHFYKRTINKMEFDSTLAYQEQHAEMPLPCPAPPAPIPEIGTIPMPPFPYQERLTFLANNLPVALQYVLSALHAIWKQIEAVRAETLLLSEMDTCSLADYQNDQEFQLRSVSRNIKFTTIRTIGRVLARGIDEQV